MVCYCVLGQDASPVCVLSEAGVNENLVGQCLLVCLNSYQRRDGSRVACSPEGRGGTGRDRSHNQGKLI